MSRLSKPKLPNIVILASGNGSNFETIVKATKNGILNANILMLITNKKCFAEERAKCLNIPITRLGKNWSKDLYDLLKKLNPDLVVLAGFMKILPPNIVNSFKIINIHPSLLPAFPGKDAIKQAYDYGVKVTGITIHYVDEGVDTGPIIFQKALEIDGLTLDEIETNIHKLEHEYYPKVIQKILNS
ncbi:phosphoribosylglycinamide formyltransferase [Thermosipho melanesiensis]|uniref:Phosphoribosylglycinamide formyltransferase n=2 Tax=Thermosipho melanesiensis TaxID=46541 RepID=A6LK06_THEM4|nr:phosphoribosylglycinamide formyltransferase [Thermosipho melanesiensis]ABR30257.1 phosphoribosylglycinamide formyltransferase [Thermosipho melanesiensis BI429]APT73445.1 phosphoribosylglycinamide formyltransferase [Thermosipho melanesiensis]OOC37388.1 phosphoribosylglycinamide formyltransferase [Thermosipho melanesiensis]OOC39750.1 phosphoribosylglycinamide formyltransferase [Thermosipho melanesiensis]OOC39855.1 phosphoribosylglycinamide formyltransferase [Thermosipho melanesiensis]